MQTGPEARPASPSPDGGPGWLAPAIFLSLVALRLALIGWLGLFNDEAYYWEWSRRLAPSYYDHPPGVAAVIAASTALFGRTRFAVHFPALLFSVATSLVLYRFSLELFPGRRRLAWWSVVLLNVAPLLGLGSVFTTPDAPSLFLWTLTAALVWRAVHGSPRLWYLAGVTSGLGLLSKYNFVLLPLSVGLYLLHPRHRGWWRRREPWLALAIAALLFFPVVAWNAGHGWGSFAYHLVERHGTVFRPWPKLLRFLVAQQSLSPLLWLACVVALVRSFRLARAGSDEHWYLFCCTAVALAFFGAWSLFTFVNPNWFGLAFATLMVPTADLLGRSRSRLVRIVPGALAALVTLAFYLQAFTLVLPIPPRVDFATDLHGWEEVGARLREIRAAMPRPERVFAYSRRFQLSALAAFHAGDDLEVTRIGGARRDEYDQWRRPELLRGRDAIFFCDDWYPDTPASDPFRSCEPAGDLPIVRSGRTVRRFSFWICRDYQP